MVKSSAVGLLEIEPDFGRFLTAEEAEAARKLMVPTLTLERSGADVIEQIEDTGAFGALVLEGMLVNELRSRDQLAVRLLGPGDLLWLGGGPLPMVLTGIGYRAVAPTRLALLGDELLLAAHHWPRLVAGLHMRLGQQGQRLAAQLVICQMPRVDQRLVALMWLLAESWGRVTPAGTVLPLSLTHDLLGALVGARRSTVTLALGELADRGAIVRRDHGWLLLEATEGGPSEPESVRAPALFDEVKSDWYQTPEADDETERIYEQIESSYLAIREAVMRLREQHTASSERFAERLGALASTRQRCADSRQRVARQRVRRRRSPSS